MDTADELLKVVKTIVVSLKENKMEFRSFNSFNPTIVFQISVTILFQKQNMYKLNSCTDVRHGHKVAMSAVDFTKLILT